MACNRLTARKSTDHQSTGQLAPRNVPPPQEPHHDSLTRASLEEEPFEIELVVPASQAAQGPPAEEQQQQEDHDIINEEEDDEEYSPLSDNEGEKLYRDADERESFGAEAPIPTDRHRALLGHLGITSALRYRIKVVPRLGQVEFKVVAVTDAAWQAITSWSRCNKGEL
jgi:hypothetical protein